MGEFLVMVAGFTTFICVTAVVISGAVKRARGDAGESRAVRELRDEIDLLRGEMDSLRGDLEQARRPPELDDIQNRLDFAERMLAQVKARDALPGPR